MSPSSPQVKTVLVIGATGNVGKPIIKHLVAHGFQVSGLTRPKSSPIELPPGVKHITTDYTQASLEQAFARQDAVINTTSGAGVAVSKTIVDAAIAAGVKIYFPSEYGVDTSVSAAADVIPSLKSKIETLNYLKSKQDQISWVALITGSLFDWSLDIPTFGGLNIPARTATIYDTGDVPYEATNLDQMGQAVVSILEQDLPSIRNQYIYINSFTVTQNQVVRALEKATGDAFTQEHESIENLRKDGFELLQNKDASLATKGLLNLITSAFYGKGFGVANYSASKGLWNERLGLAQEDLGTFLESYVKREK